MKFADKLILLRKQNGISQEELADRLDVSRQSVSKWESEQSMPELSKILQLAEMFGVSTDYLLKDDMESQGNNTNSQTKINTSEGATKKFTQSEVEQYINHSKTMARLYVIATALCIISIAPLLILLANSAFTLLSETLSIILGIAGLLVFVCWGVGCFIYARFKNQEYAFIDKQNISLDNSTKKYVEGLKQSYYPSHIRNVIIGTVFSIVALIPVIIFPLLVSGYIGLGLCITLVLVIVGVAFFIYSYIRLSALNKLLNDGEYSVKNKRVSQTMAKIASIYWMLVTAIFLTYSFISNDWGRSWIVWPVAAVLYAVVSSVAEILIDKKVNSATSTNKTEDNSTTIDDKQNNK